MADEQTQEVVVQEPLEPTGEVETPALDAEPTEAPSTSEETPPDPSGAPVKAVQVPPERIEEITYRRREAERERDWLRLQVEKLTRGESPPPPAPEPAPFTVPPPRQEDFETYEQYEEAVFDHRYQKRAQAERASQEKAAKERAQQQHQSQLDEWIDKGESKYPDFKRVAQDNDLKITPFMAGAMQESDIGHDVAYHLGQNPKEAARIAKLSPLGQVREIGRLEVKLQTPTQRANTNAPTPTSPVGGKEAPSVKLEDMSYEEYKAHRLKQLVKGK